MRPPTFWNNWELDEDLHAADQLVRRFRDAPPESIGRGDGLPKRGTAGSKVDPRMFQVRAARRLGKARSWNAGALVSWTLIGLGLAVAILGGVLMAGSLVAVRPDLWRQGAPYTIAGQAVLLVGLVLQLDVLRRNQREANDALAAMDDKLTEIRHATTLNISQDNAGRSFYLHLAEGASPHILLADLKGQIDLLATRLSEER